MNNHGHPHGHTRAYAKKRSKSEFAEIMKPTHHTRRRNRGSDKGEESVGEEKNKRRRDAKSEQKSPVKETVSNPDDKRKKDVNEEITQGMKKFQSCDEFARKAQNLFRDPGWKKPEQEGEKREAFLSQEIEEENDDKQKRSKSYCSYSQVVQQGKSVTLSLKVEVIRGPEEKEDAQKSTHGKKVKDTLNYDCAHGKPLAHLLLMGEVEWFYQLAQPAGKEKGDGEAEDIA